MFTGMDQMKVMIVYFSKFGHTQHISEMMAQALMIRNEKMYCIEGLEAKPNHRYAVCPKGRGSAWPSFRILLLPMEAGCR